MKSDYENYNKEEFQKLISESNSIAEILRKLDLKDRGANHTKLSKFLKESDYDLSSLKGRHIKRYDDTGVPKKWLSEVLCENSSGNSNKIKKRLLEWGVKEYKCENPECGISEWHGKPISLELHHINGNHYDNRLENLVLLCPNCHSQTSNFRGKNSNDKFNKILSKVAIDEAKTGMENLLKFEEQRKQEIKDNQLKWCGEIGKRKELKEKEIKYCKKCGNEIKGRGKIFCSTKCMIEYEREQTGYDVEDIIKKAYECSSLEELGRCFNITGAGVKKRLKSCNKLDEVKQILNSNKKDYSVIQYDVNNNFIKQWESGKIAAEVLKLNKNHLYNCCNNKQKTCGGFIWKFAKES